MKKITIARFLLNTFFALFFILVAFSSASHSFAQTTPTTPAATPLSITLDNPLGTTTDINGFLAKILDGIVILLTPVIVVMFLWTGFLFVKAQGNPEELSGAKKSLLYTIIGAALVLGAKGFSLVIAATIAKL